MLNLTGCVKVIGADAIRFMTIDKLAKVVRRFWKKTKAGPGDCLLWTGAERGHGYGAFKVAQGQAGAHRVAYELVCGPIPAGLLVRHKCHTPLCVNPDHLELGTQVENLADMVAAGRHATGPGSCPRKLTVKDALAAHWANLLGLSLKETAGMFDVARCTVTHIRAGRCWEAAIDAHIDAELAKPSRKPRVIAAALDPAAP